MREKLQTLPLAELRELAKAQKIKGWSTMRKAELIDILCSAAEQEEIIKTAVAPPLTKSPNEGKSEERNPNLGKPQIRPVRDNRQAEVLSPQEVAELDSGIGANGILEVMPDGFGFIRCENFLPGENDVYVAPSQIRRFNLKTGDIIVGNRRVKTAAEKFAALLYIKNVNGYPISVIEKRPNFENLTPIFPNERLHMETMEKTSTAMRVLDLLSPIGKGQRGMIVSPPKAGKTTLLKQVAQAITTNHSDMPINLN